MMFTTRKPPIDMFREFPDLHGMAKYCIRLHPRAVASSAAKTSKMGGAFLHPRGEAWPRDAETGEEYYPVLQVLKKDLPRATRGIAPLFSFPEGTDCFQLLWVPKSNDDLPPSILTRWLATSNRRLSAYRVPYREGKLDRLFPKECKLHPEEVLEYPHRWALSGYHQELLLSNAQFLKLAGEHGHADNPLAFYQTHLCCAPGTKLLGHPRWIQNPEWPLSDRGFAMEHLLTVSSWEWDSGDFSRWKPVEEARPRTAQGASDDAGLLLGDAGDIYVCISRREAGWPVKAVFQCS